ncbi:MAG: AAA family ATPase [Bacteroidota bacterium]|nr:AAA family ATPase [Bacteroidota bacterium]
MNNLQQKFYEKYALTQTKNIRNFINTIDWTNRFIGIKGSRGIGKTTLLLQYIKLNYKANNSVIYISMDNFYFTENRLYDFADEFQKTGGQFLAIDEIHRYKGWAAELKNIYDDMPNLKVAFTGSSLLHLQKAKADLSRRAVMYEMPGLSYREFLVFEKKINLPIISLDDILNNHIEIGINTLQKLKPLVHFSDYLNFGYYPFYLENKKSFQSKLNETLLTVLEVDIPQFESIKISNIIYLKKLLKVISRSVPFKPNIKTLSQRTGISVNTLKLYLQYLNDANLLSMLYAEERGINSLNRPDKIYLENTNLIHNLADNIPNIGNIRETFFYNQTKYLLKVNTSKQSDFLINDTYTFEIDGKSKGQKQIKNLENSFIVKDNIEIGSGNIIPIWLFGFLY